MIYSLRKIRLKLVALDLIVSLRLGIKQLSKGLHNESNLKDFTFKNVMAIQTIGDVIRNLELQGSK